MRRILLNFYNMQQKTQAFRFVLPMLADYTYNDDFSPNNFKFFKRDSLINVYIGDDNEPKYSDKILLYYKYDHSIDYLTFDRKLELLPTYLTKYEYGGSTMYVFDVPDEFKDDFEHFKVGKYSKFSIAYKKQILDFYGLKGKDNYIYSILFKTDLIDDYLKEAHGITKEQIGNKNEYWFKPDIDNEYFDEIIITSQN